MRRVLLICLAIALSAQAQTSDTTARIEALERELEQLRTAAPMTLKPFLVVSRPAKFFGDYEERKDATFGRGEKMHFYLEPKNLVYPRAGSGVYEPNFEVDLEVHPAKGEPIKQPRFGSFKIPSRSRLQDILRIDLQFS